MIMVMMMVVVVAATTTTTSYDFQQSYYHESLNSQQNYNNWPIRPYYFLTFFLSIHPSIFICPIINNLNANEACSRTGQ